MDQPAVIAPPKKLARLNIFQRFAENPVILKELRGRMRGRRSFIAMTLYLGLISIFIGAIYAVLDTQGSMARFDPSFRQNVGKVIFSSIVIFEFLFIGFIGPSLTAGAITSERERRTFDLLRTTLLSARALVFGKLASACMYLILLVFAALPIQALAFLLGGVGLEEIVISSIMLFINILFFCTLGIFCSSITKRTLSATITSYIIILVSVMILGMAYFGIITAMSRFYSVNQDIQDLIMAFMLLLSSVNSISAGVVSEALLIANQTVFWGKVPSSNNIYIISPWVLHVLLYAFMTVFLFTLSIIFVKRPDK